MNGFVHSIPVPKIYKAAATIVELVQEKGQSIKELVFSKKYSRINTKGLYALIVETLQHESILCDIIRESKILADGRLKPWLARVLITELLWGKKKLPPNDCKPIQAVLDLHSEFVAILKKAVLDGTHVNEPRIKKEFAKPRYVRVNTIKLSIDEAMDAFAAEGWYRGYPDVADDYPSFLSKLANIGEMEFVQDFHVAEVFAFPPRTEFYNHELYLSGCLVLQDKATSLAAFLLAPTPGSIVLDMCAAPGLKTTQLAAMMNNQGTLYAVEKSIPRYRTLVEFAAHHGAEISPINADASTLTTATIAGVEFVLVDPSCSGSGMQRPTDHDFDSQRVAKLAGFQVILLERALMNFPEVKRVVYSTCSNYAEENEQVVEKVLKTVNPDPENPNYKLADVLVDSWVSRGSDEYQCGPKCVYAREDVDLTTGFFMAVFERIGNGSFEVKMKRKRFRGKKMRELTHNGGEGESNERAETCLQKDGEEVEDSVDNVREKKKQKRMQEEEAGLASDEKIGGTLDAVVERRKKKSRKRNETGEENGNAVDNVDTTMEEKIESREVESIEEKDARRKAKKHRKQEMLQLGSEAADVGLDEVVVSKKKKKKERSVK